MKRLVSAHRVEARFLDERVADGLAILGAAMKCDVHATTGRLFAGFRHVDYPGFR